jgi:AAA domain
VTTLQTRKPTGAVPWPLILIEGPEKSGKSWAAAVLSASTKVGRTLWLDLNEGAADEYGAVPGARYEVIEHDGSWASILGQVAAAKDEASRAAAHGEPPVVLIIDSVTAEWDLLKDWASARAAQSKSNKKKLEDDPAAEVQVPMNLWNDATARHRRLMTILMTFPGIVVMTARGKEVASLDANGRPIEGTKEYKVEGHKTLAYDASVWVRLSRDRAPVVVGARSVHAGIRPGVDKPEPAPNLTLEWLIFDVLKCDPAKAHARDLVEPKPGRTPEQIRDEALETTTTFERIKELYTEAKDGACETAEVQNEHGDQETLARLLYRVGTERKTPAQSGARS